MEIDAEKLQEDLEDLNEMAGATSKIFRQLHDSDLKFGSLENEDGQEIELSPSTFSQFLIWQRDGYFIDSAGSTNFSII